jgi:hypothetical protein
MQMLFPISDLEKAWGQFFLYARALRKRDPSRRLYLAVHQNVFETIFQEEAGELLLEEPGFCLVEFIQAEERIEFKWRGTVEPES